jgi:hypothetical protein
MSYRPVLCPLVTRSLNHMTRNPKSIRWSAEGLNVRRHTVHLVLLMYLIGFSHCSGKFKSSTPHQCCNTIDASRQHVSASRRMVCKTANSLLHVAVCGRSNEINAACRKAWMRYNQAWRVKPPRGHLVHVSARYARQPAHAANHKQEMALLHIAVWMRVMA